MPGDPSVRFLRVDGQWPDIVELHGLEVGAEALRLARVPAAPVSVGQDRAESEAFSGPAGIGVASDGTVYVADPVNHRIVRVGPCGGAGEPLPCLNGPGSEPGQLDEPRGVLVGPRGALYIADTGNHRVQVVDPRTMQVVAVWGATDAGGGPVASDEDGGFREPWDLAADAACNVYVSSPGSSARSGTAYEGRVQKFSADGRVDASFWATMRATGPPGSPTAISVVAWTPDASDATKSEGAERLLVIDAVGHRMLVYRLSGEYDEDGSKQLDAIAARAGRPIAVAADADVLYVADADRGRVLLFSRDGHFLGVARDLGGTAAGLALDRRGRLLVHGGAGASAQRFEVAESYAECGTFLAGPFEGGAVAPLHRVIALVDGLGTAAHLRMFTLTSNTLDGTAGSRPAVPADCAGARAADEPQSEPTPRERWRAAPADASEVLLLHQPGRYLWVAGMLWGDGHASPKLTQLRVEYNHPGWLRHLPAMYSREENGREFLERLLALFETALLKEERLVDRLPELFDPWAAPDEVAGSWLEWLSSWVAFPLQEGWPDHQRRTAVSEAFALQARRGTVESLERVVALHAGAPVRIDEPSAHASLWALGEGRGLGISTMLAPAHPSGAILGTTTALDQSRLVEGSEEGAPLFEDLAHHFRVEMYAADLPTPEAVSAVRRVIDREKPAHTTYHLCVIEPRLRVGVQYRVGIDALVGRPPPPLALGGIAALGLDAVLADSREVSNAIGQTARVG